jgi:hypothetical protein
VLETSGDERLQHAFARVAERRVPEIVPERDRLRQFFVQAQYLRDAARDLRDLERVREACAVVIAGWRKKDLRLVLQTSEGLAGDDAIAIALKCGADGVFLLGPEAAAGIAALRRLRGQNLVFARLEVLADRRSHHNRISRRKLVPFASGPTLNRSATV